MRTVLLSSLICVCGLLPVHADVQAIMEAHNRQLLSTLTSYLDENPEAPDHDQARQGAIQTAAQLGENGLVISLLTQALEDTLEQDPVPVQEAAQLGMMAAKFASSNGMKKEIKDIYTKLKANPEVQQSPMFINAESQLQAMLELPGIGEKPTLTGKTVDGEELDLEAYRGKVVLLDFWATWCPPCMAELPTMLETYETYHDKGFEIIGISADRNRAALTGVMKQKGISWPNLYNNEQEESIVEAFKIRAFPTMFLLDQEGTIVAMNTRGEALAKAVAKLLEEGDKD